jgi:pimeloyl-ACP methyl ester carboxylesterase
MGSDGRTTLDGQGKFPVASPKALVGRRRTPAWRPLQQGDLNFMADWGFETYARDVENMIALVKQESGSKNVFLAGHSQGGSFTSVFAGRLGTDGQRGHQNLAGIVMLDGGGYGTLTSPTVTQVEHAEVRDRRPAQRRACGLHRCRGRQLGLGAGGRRAGDGEPALHHRGPAGGVAVSAAPGGHAHHHRLSRHRRGPATTFSARSG